MRRWWTRFRQRLAFRRSWWRFRQLQSRVLGVLYGQALPWVALGAMVVLTVWLMRAGATQDDVGDQVSDASSRPLDLLSVGLDAKVGVEPSPIDLGVALLVLLVLARYWRLSALAFRPGPIQIDDLDDARGAAGSDAAAGVPPPNDLTTRLRAELTRRAIVGPGTVPGGGVSSNQLQAVSDAPGDARWFEWASTLLVRFWPMFAYRVSGTVQVDDTRVGGDHLGIAVQAQRIGLALRGRTGPHTACWGRTWEEAVEKAAASIAAFIIPRTARGRTEPWGEWGRRGLTGDLLHAYVTAQQRVSERRFDEALACFDGVLEHDGDCPTVRVELAEIYERLNYALDAIVAYDQACELARTGPNPDVGGVASYRLGITLGKYASYAEDWLDPSSTERVPGPRRARDRVTLRGLVRDVVEDPLGLERGRRRDGETGYLPEPGTVDSGSRNPADTDQRRVEAERFELASLTVLFWLADQGQLLRGDLATAVDEPGIELAIRWAEARAFLGWDDLPREIPPDHGSCAHLKGWLEQRQLRLPDVVNSSIRRSRRRMRARTAQGPAPPTMAGGRPDAPVPGRWWLRTWWYRQRWRRLEAGRWPEQRRVRPPRRDTFWQTRYNAACVGGIFLQRLAERQAAHERYQQGIASAVLSFGVPVADVPCTACTTLEPMVVRFTIDQLELSILDRDSQFRGEARSWLLDEDPDLEVLRRTEAFRNLRARFYPAGDTAAARPELRAVRNMEAEWFTTQLIAGVARAREHYWHDMETAEQIDVHDLAAAWEGERLLVSAIVEVAHEPRDWKARVALARRSESVGSPSESIGYPSYATIEHRRLRRATEATVEEAVATLHGHALAALDWLGEPPTRGRSAPDDDGSPQDDGGHVPDRRDRPCDQKAVAWEATVYLRAVDAGTKPPLHRREVTHMARGRAAFWQRIAQTLELQDDGLFAERPVAVPTASERGSSPAPAFVVRRDEVLVSAPPWSP